MRTIRRTRARLFLLSVVALSIALASVLFVARPAAAHATLLAVSPADDSVVERAPAAVELRFDEPVEVLTGGIRVFDPGGERIDGAVIEEAEGGAVLRVPIEGRQTGTYTVAWRVLSEDSHNLAGSFVFHVQERTGATDLDEDADQAVAAAGALGRWLGLAGLLTTIGGIAVGLSARRDDAVAGRCRPVVLVGAISGAVGAELALLAQAAQVSGRSLGAALGVVMDLAVDTRTGQLMSARAVALAVVAVGVVTPLWSRARWLLAVPGAVAVVCLSAAGHAWTAPTRVAAVVSDAVHVGAAGIWAGGLIAFAAALPVATDRARLARSFSSLALVTAIAVGASGSVSAFIQVRSVEALTSTGYGQLVLAKIVGFSALLLLGWRNRVQLVPRVARGATALVRAVRIEVVVVASVLALTAGLVNQPPARDSVARPFSTVVETDDAVLQASVEPARTGSNDLHLYFFDDAGQVFPVDAVEITAATGDIPPRRLDVTPISASHVSAYGASLSSPGTWTIAVTAVSAGVPVIFTFEVPIR